MQRIIVHIGEIVFLLDTLVRGIEGTKKILNAILDDRLLRLGLVVDLAIFVAKRRCAARLETAGFTW